MKRRDFVLSALALGAVGTFIEACKKEKSGSSASGPSLDFTIDISTSQYSTLQQNGKSVHANNVIIARDGSGNFIALYDVCTHNGCTLSFNGSSQFPCPCHGAIFDTNGNVVNGPANQPVKKYSTTLNGTMLRVFG